MFDDITLHIIGIINTNLQSIGFDTKMLGYANIEMYPDKKELGISFAPVEKEDSTGIRYVILIYPHFYQNFHILCQSAELYIIYQRL